MQRSSATEMIKDTQRGALAARLAAECRGRHPVRRLQPRPLCHGCLVLPNHAAGRVAPRTIDDALRTLAIARDQGVTVTPRGGGTSQCGQTINRGTIVDFSKHLNHVLSVDPEGRTCVVEPGMVLDDLNRQLKPHGLWFPVDVSTASRATIGGMAGNNSCGGRSLRYGTMRDNTIAIDAALADGSLLRFRVITPEETRANADEPGRSLFRDLLGLGERERHEIAARFPEGAAARRRL